MNVFRGRIRKLQGEAKSAIRVPHNGNALGETDASIQSKKKGSVTIGLANLTGF